MQFRMEDYQISVFVCASLAARFDVMAMDFIRRQFNTRDGALTVLGTESGYPIIDVFHTVITIDSTH